MAFITKSGKRFAVRHGVTGNVIRTFSSEKQAASFLADLHKKHDPKTSNRGKRAQSRFNKG